MKPSSARLLPGLLVLFLVSVAQAEQRTLSARDIEVEDGDTLHVRLDDNTHRVQLVGIDAPEDRNNPKLQVDIKRSGLSADELIAMGQASTRLLRFLVDTQSPLTLHFDPKRKDRYGRLPGDLFNADGESIAEQMVSDGYAIALTRGLDNRQATRLKALEHKARQRRRGLWGLFREASRRWGGVDQTEGEARHE